MMTGAKAKPFVAPDKDRINNWLIQAHLEGIGT